MLSLNYNRETPSTLVVTDKENLVLGKIVYNEFFGQIGFDRQCSNLCSKDLQEIQYVMRKIAHAMA